MGKKKALQVGCFLLFLIGIVIFYWEFEKSKTIPFEQAFENLSKGHPRIDYLGIEVWRETKDLNRDNPMDNSRKVVAAEKDIYAIFTQEVFEMSVKKTDIPPELSYILYLEVATENILIIVGKDGTIHIIGNSLTYLADKNNPLLTNIEKYLK